MSTSPTSSQTEPHGFPRWVPIVLLGPLVGSLIMLAVVMVLEPPLDDPDFWDMLFRFSAFVLVIGYLTGTGPAILSALTWHFGIARMHGARLRVCAALAAGGLTGSLGVWPVMDWLFGTYAPNAQFYLLSGAAGAIALLVTARPWKEG